MARIGQTLCDLAREHDGVFTAAEAAEAGVSHEALAMAARRGTIKRLSRGIYRLLAYPADEELVQQWEAVLWPTTQRGTLAQAGVLSHLTALRANYTRLDYTPPKVSITLPPTVRIRRAPPPWLDIHYAELSDDEVTSINGPAVTTLERTLRDCIDAGVERRLILRTIEGLRDRELPEVLPPAKVRELVERLG